MMTSLLSFVPCDSTILNKAVRPAVAALSSSPAFGLEVLLSGNSIMRLAAPLECEWEAHRCQVLEKKQLVEK